MTTDDFRDITFDEAKRVCRAVIISAHNDLKLRIPPLRATYDSVEKLKDAQSRRADSAQRIRSALWFFKYNPESHFEWMAPGVGIHPGEARRALRPKIRAAHARPGARGGPSLPLIESARVPVATLQL
jgi:hypothetical protein